MSGKNSPRKEEKQHQTYTTFVVTSGTGNQTKMVEGESSLFTLLVIQYNSKMVECEVSLFTLLVIQ